MHIVFEMSGGSKKRARTDDGPSGSRASQQFRCWNCSRPDCQADRCPRASWCPECRVEGDHPYRRCPVRRHQDTELERASVAEMRQSMGLPLLSLGLPLPSAQPAPALTFRAGVVPPAPPLPPPPEPVMLHGQPQPPPGVTGKARDLWAQAQARERRQERKKAAAEKVKAEKTVARIRKAVRVRGTRQFLAESRARAQEQRRLQAVLSARELSARQRHSEALRSARQEGFLAGALAFRGRLPPGPTLGEDAEATEWATAAAARWAEEQEQRPASRSSLFWPPQFGGPGAPPSTAGADPMEVGPEPINDEPRAMPDGDAEMGDAPDPSGPPGDGTTST